MGCAGSKPDDLPAVALCRQRCNFLEEAIRQRYALAEAHVAYIGSLKQIGYSLHNFIEHDFSRFGGEPPSPELNLPPARKKGDPLEEGSSSPKKSHSNSDSHGHIDFHDSDSDFDSETHSLHHSDHSSPLHGYEGGSSAYSPVNYPNYGNLGQEPGPYPGGGGGFMHMNFMRNKATPSVVYEQRPMSPEMARMEIGESSSSSYYPYSGNNPGSGSSSYPNFGYSNPNYSNFNNYPNYGSAPPPPAVASSSKPPPAPPSPPKSSAWDFLNLFESYENHYISYTPSRNSRDVREDEGIPDLEDEDYQHEVVKEVHGRQKFVDTASHSNSKSPVEEKDGKVEDEASFYQTRPSVGMESDGVEYDVHVVEKKVVNDEKPEERGNVAQGGSRDVNDVAREIEVQFVRASESGNEISNVLEVGKFPYKRKHVTSKMLHVVTPSLSVVSSRPSTSKSANPSSSTEGATPAMLDIPEELARGSKNLSSTLHKLFLWEKKLLNEVKAEERLRIDHEKKCSKLKRMDEKGAEPHKIDLTRTAISELSTKIRIAIQVVDKISVTINKIRDEELWPQLNELIQGLNRMWRSMLECHQSQCQAIREAKNLGSLGSHKKLGDTHLDATSQLEHELLNWTFRFTTWVCAQKGYVTALNNWLFKCILYEPETTEDGPVPFSPGRLGAPPVFVICHQWAEAINRISEKEVVSSMRVFAMSVFELWEHDKTDMRERMMANKDLDRKVKNLDREDQKIQKEIQALDKKIVMASGDGNGLSVTGNMVYQSDTSSGNLQGHLLHIFEAMERFATQSSKAYEELLQRAEEETVAQQQHERVS